MSKGKPTWKKVLSCGSYVRHKNMEILILECGHVSVGLDLDPKKLPKKALCPKCLVKS